MPLTLGLMLLLIILILVRRGVLISDGSMIIILSIPILIISSNSRVLIYIFANIFGIQSPLLAVAYLAIGLLFFSNIYLLISIQKAYMQISKLVMDKSLRSLYK